MSSRHESPTFGMPEQESFSWVFFREAFAQAKNQPLKAKTFSGKFLPRFVEIADRNKDKLAEIDPTLPPQFLMPTKTMDKEHFDHFQNLERNKRWQVFSASSSHEIEVDSFAQDELVPSFFNQHLGRIVHLPPDVG